ncbi:ROK family transcriptional regulator [Parendozoicomonas haliclonae]|uniref:N-acetylglucosamine repressor n=1 Tax=Parendozoicomonas haliclonae TaxID=1960125 RepID=A0A1X7ANR7_9GAMM|nr:ROK family transcriptional regulator [Parendozoicomonas haliclonae]SMA49905.1 N-acetylglucosamine repressor [Parendozoicomonas haliclonae]
MPAVIVNLDYVKEKNTSAVFKAIVEHGAISRIQIARTCLLAAGSVTRITRLLLENGLIQEVESQSHERGRPSVLLVARKQSLHILTISADRHHIHYGLCDLSGELLAEHKEPLQATQSDEFLQQIIQSTQTFIQQHSQLTRQLIGIGITTPGLVHSETGVVHSMPHLQTYGLPLADRLKQATGLPCFVGNFSSAITLAEHQLTPHNPCRNSLLVSIHNGVGAGMILDGRLYEGSALTAGEIGHIQIDPLGPRCYCGNFGCLESYISNSALEQQCHQQVQAGSPTSLPDNATITDICNAANQGDELARSLITNAAARLGKVLAMCTNLLNPEKIILAGEITESFSLIEPVIRMTLQRQTVSFVGEKDIQLSVSACYNRRWLAAYALMRRALLEQGLLLEILNKKALPIAAP